MIYNIYKSIYINMTDPFVWYLNSLIDEMDDYELAHAWHENVERPLEFQ